PQSAPILHNLLIYRRLELLALWTQAGFCSAANYSQPVAHGSQYLAIYSLFPD
ncbi:uncharacterized protein PgNI_01861, partial [Pyricularia grisea]|uniref:Uncharacterized protein n=1 Tax=Pyricularia grisea TaxID=148305 RepID=A0A6P8BLY8_PYRGI